MHTNNTLSQDESVLPPYELLPADFRYDLWAFANMIYNLVAGLPLLPVDCDNELTAGTIKELHEWTDEMKEDLLVENVKDPLCQDLLRVMLSEDPSSRYGTIDEALQHPFFTKEVENGILEEMEGRMVALKFKIDQRARVDKVLVAGKNFNLHRMNTLSQRTVDRSVSSLLHSVFGCDFHVPKSFVILPENEVGVGEWLRALDGVVSLMAKAVEDNGDDSDGRLSTPVNSITAFTSIRNELLIALKHYGETRFNLLWIDEVTGKTLRKPEERTISCSFLNALRFAPLMLAGLRINKRNFGVEALAKCLKVEVGGLPKCLNGETEDFEMLDVVYEFDQFQEVISKYGSFLNDDGKEKKTEEKRGGVQYAQAGEEMKKLAKALPWNVGDGGAKDRKLAAQSPVKLKRYSHKYQMADFEAFVLGRDTEFVLGGMVRCVAGGGQCGLWCKREEAAGMLEQGSVKKIDEEGKELESLRGEVGELRDKVKTMEELQRELKEMTEKNLEQNAKIMTLEEQMVVELKHREDEFVKEKKQLESTLTSTLTKGEEERNLLLGKNKKLGELEEEIRESR